MLLLSFLLALTLTPYHCLGSPLFIPGKSLIFDKIDITGKSDTPADELIPETTKVVNGRVEPLRQTIKDMLSEARKRIEDLRVKARCVQSSASEASQQATQGISEATSCSLKAVQTASTRINRVVDQLQKNIFSLADIARTFVKEVVSCGSAPDIRECDRQALLTAETSVSRVSASIQTRLNEAAVVWKKLIEDLKLCSVAGAEDVTEAESQLLQRILKCVS